MSDNRITKKEALRLLIDHLKLLDKTFKSYDAKAISILDFVEDTLGMTPPQKRFTWKKEIDEYDE